eukprot:scaffold21569_cov107-Isochrysis_galbana.AAC.9
MRVCPRRLAAHPATFARSISAPTGGPASPSPATFASAMGRWRKQVGGGARAARSGGTARRHLGDGLRLIRLAAQRLLHHPHQVARVDPVNRGVVVAQKVVRHHQQRRLCRVCLEWTKLGAVLDHGRADKQLDKLVKDDLITLVGRVDVGEHRPVERGGLKELMDVPGLHAASAVEESRPVKHGEQLVVVEPVLGAEELAGYALGVHQENLLAHAHSRVLGRTGRQPLGTHPAPALLGAVLRVPIFPAQPKHRHMLGNQAAHLGPAQLGPNRVDSRSRLHCRYDVVAEQAAQLACQGHFRRCPIASTKPSKLSVARPSCGSAGGSDAFSLGGNLGAPSTSLVGGPSTDSTAWSKVSSEPARDAACAEAGEGSCSGCPCPTTPPKLRPRHVVMHSTSISYRQYGLRVSITGRSIASVTRKSTSEHVSPLPSARDSLSILHHWARQSELPAPPRSHASPGAADAASCRAVSSAPAGGPGLAAVRVKHARQLPALHEQQVPRLPELTQPVGRLVRHQQRREPAHHACQLAVGRKDHLADHLLLWWSPQLPTVRRPVGRLLLASVEAGQAEPVSADGQQRVFEVWIRPCLHVGRVPRRAHRRHGLPPRRLVPALKDLARSPGFGPALREHRLASLELEPRGRTVVGQAEREARERVLQLRPLRRLPALVGVPRVCRSASECSALAGRFHRRGERRKHGGQVAAAPIGRAQRAAAALA